MPSNRHVAAVQLNGQPEWERNQPQIERLVGEGARQGARVVVLPEYLYAMPANLAQWADLGIESDDVAVTWLGRLARHWKVWLVAGTLPIRSHDERDRLWARSLVIDDAGAIRAHYDKIHLFDVDLPDRDESYRESQVFAPGQTPVVVDTPAGPMGMSICFDLRFPELFRALVDAGAQWISLPAAFTESTGHAHWHTLIRARAIENEVYMVAAAQVGTHASGRSTYGHSLIVDPWGGVLEDAGERVDGLISADLDPKNQQNIRRLFPVLDMRRPFGSVRRID